MAHSILPTLWNDENKGDVFSALHKQIDRVFEDFHTGKNWPFGMLATDNGKMAPRVNVAETDKAIEVTAELPGVEENDIDVTLRDDILTIKGEKRTESKREEKLFNVEERTYGSFERSMRLPCEVNDQKVNADFKNGVLTVKLRKTPAAKKKTKKIEIKAN